jgi:predicted RNA binding protein YcfA (HicA-like mRNA interferase family)
MTSRELTKLLEAKGCTFVRSGKGSHQIWRCPGGCQTVIPSHRGDIPSGTLRSIQRSLEACLGKEWWK